MLCSLNKHQENNLIDVNVNLINESNCWVNDIVYTF